MNQPDIQQGPIQALLRSPSESLEVEIKGWLDPANPQDRANLAKAMIALANHGGGRILIGFSESPQGYRPSTDDRPASLDGYSTDSINDIVKRYAEPIFHCICDHVTHPDTGQPHPVIRVPGGHKTPIRSKRAGPGGKTIRQNAYYIRRPGPASEEPKSGGEWDDFLRRCIVNARDKLVKQFRLIMDGVSTVAPSPSEEDAVDEWRRAGVARWNQVVREASKQDTVYALPNGFFSVAYVFAGINRDFSLHALLKALRRGAPLYTGWPPFAVPNDLEAEPYPHDDGIECWMGHGVPVNTPAYVDLWRVSSSGQFFLLRGYLEDGEQGIDPGTELALVSPMWELGGILLHAASMAEHLDITDARVVLTIEWNGLASRRLTTRFSPSRIPIHGNYLCRQESFQTAIVVQQADRIETTLAEIVTKALTPLYERFAFFPLAPRFVVEELDKMRSRRL